MSSFSAYLEQKIYDWMVKASDMPSSPATVYLGLSTASPVDDGSGLAEPADVAYVRKAVTFGARSSTNGVGTSGSTSANIVFDTATESWGTITHGALFDAESGGNMLDHWEWTVPKAIGIGDTYIVAAGDLALLIR